MGNHSKKAFLLVREDDNDEMIIMGIFTAKEKAEDALSEIKELYEKARKEGFMKYFSYPFNLNGLDIVTLKVDEPDIHGII